MIKVIDACNEKHARDVKVKFKLRNKDFLFYYSEKIKSA